MNIDHGRLYEVSLTVLLNHPQGSCSVATAAPDLAVERQQKSFAAVKNSVQCHTQIHNRLDRAFLW